jgi:hypothetical protein
VVKILSKKPPWLCTQKIPLKITQEFLQIFKGSPVLVQKTTFREILAYREILVTCDSTKSLSELFKLIVFVVEY